MKPYWIVLAISALALQLPIAQAQQTTPAGRQPLPDAPPPPQSKIDPNLEPEVTILEREDAKVEEFRVSGKLYMMKVTPKSGSVYYLVDERGDGQFIRKDVLDTGLRPPQWVIFRF